MVTENSRQNRPKEKMAFWTIFEAFGDRPIKNYPSAQLKYRTQPLNMSCALRIPIIYLNIFFVFGCALCYFSVCSKCPLFYIKPIVATIPVTIALVHLGCCSNKAVEEIGEKQLLFFFFA